MTYEEAQAHSLTVRWKLETCGQGDACWCRILTPEEPILYDDGHGGTDELYIAASGCVPTIYAEHIVKLHNDSLDDQ